MRKDVGYDPEEACVQCGAVLPVTNMMYDTHESHYVCDRSCFDDWTDDHMDVMADYYFDNNVE